MYKIAEFLILSNDIASEIKSLENNIEQKFKIKLNLMYNKFVDGIVVSSIIVPKENRNKGVGTQAMQLVCSFADKFAKLRKVPEGLCNAYQARSLPDP